MECVVFIKLAFNCDEIVPVVQPRFPEWSKEFEQFFCIIVSVCIVVGPFCRVPLCLVVLEV